MGAQLAREFKHEADIVVGVPNSSLSAAMGFAEESGLPNEWPHQEPIHPTYLYPTDSRITGARGADEIVCSFWCCQRQACGYD